MVQPYVETDTGANLIYWLDFIQLFNNSPQDGLPTIDRTTGEVTFDSSVQTEVALDKTSGGAVSYNSGILLSYLVDIWWQTVGKKYTWAYAEDVQINGAVQWSVPAEVLA